MPARPIPIRTGSATEPGLAGRLVRQPRQAQQAWAAQRRLAGSVVLAGAAGVWLASAGLARFSRTWSAQRFWPTLVALVSAADSADPPAPSVGWPSCPGRLLCAPICTTPSSPASVSNPERSLPAHQMKKQAQNNGCTYSAYATCRIGPASTAKLR